MSKIIGFGEAKWSAMMGSASFELEGVDAFVTIWPKDLKGPKPVWWPKRVADHLPPNEPVTVEMLKELLPRFSEVEWEQSVRGTANTLEIHAVLGDLRIVIIGHANSSQADAMEEKTKDLRETAIEFQSLIS
ncbi:MAG: hypothetical protein GY734_17990 [Herbaspirillum sp.]|uniref:hypothetical protein n=1 Tax=Herbaspirillum sp. TaxID=1890675 RepID=UPI00258AA614|nr:hypothetical protein [Herbaspirillum sp.]MCP3655420.1 hypothetical protein [Herbaspirillum sp.]MCP3947517.1 hypothetical protein [Herbaspirillum sp.]MCP3947530.1 hypothetical protein [Herbaspirillum sp.]MCP4033101.1 hypothetical protein [Herbaspirillum sp.]MCP4556812.1 hypothetical protein [Herbaspirillum sp.]